MKSYFPDDSYDTPEDTPRYLGDRLLLNSRWGFYLRFIKIIVKASKLAVKGLLDNKEWVKASLNVFKAIERFGGRFHLKGIDNLGKSKEPVVIISNHMSTLETVIFPCIIVPFRPTTFVVKESLVTRPIFGPIMRSREPIVVGRTNPKEDLIKVLTEGQMILEKGTSLVIFPQSTRHIHFDPEKFNSLGIKVAKRAGVKVIPAAIKTDFWGNSKHFIKDLGPIDRKKPIHMTFGEPMEIKGSGKEEHKEIIEFIASNLSKWHDSKVS